MWEHVSDLSGLGEWLVMHEAWRSELPEELSKGTQIVGVARAKGLRNRVTWTVTTWDPPHRGRVVGIRQGRREVHRHAHRVAHQRGFERWACVSSWAGGRCSARWARRRPAPSKAMSRSR